MSCDLVTKIEQAFGTAKKDEDWGQAFMMYQIHQRAADLRREHRARVENAKQMLLIDLPVESVTRFSGLSIDDAKIIRDTISTKPEVN